MNGVAVRRRILRHFAETGLAPDHDDLRRWGVRDPRSELADQAADHAVVLDTAGSIVMANPFSGVPTNWRVDGAAMSWFANCAWDALSIPIALSVDATVHSVWMDTGEAAELAVESGECLDDGFVHFEVPARHWWDDVVHT